MKTKIMFCTMVLLLSLFAGRASGAPVEGTYNTFFGQGTGANIWMDVFYDTFIGAWAGTSNTWGQYNTYVGYHAGYTNTQGGGNTFVGSEAGVVNSSGIANTYLGRLAG